MSSETLEGSFDFLGREFLVWLWYHCENSGGEFEIPGDLTVGVAFDGFLEFEFPDGGGKVSVRGDLPTRVPEAGVALQRGRLPSVARLVLGWADDNVTVTVDTSTFDLKSLRLLSTEGISDDGEERARMLLQVADVVDGLFGAFLTDRLSPNFRKNVAPAMKSWIATRITNGASLAATG